MRLTSLDGACTKDGASAPLAYDHPYSKRPTSPTSHSSGYHYVAQRFFGSSIKCQVVAVSMACFLEQSVRIPVSRWRKEIGFKRG